MPDDPVPHVEREHYDTIRALAPDLPPKYDDWLRRRDQYIAARRQKGRDPWLVPITPAAFQEYLAEKQGKEHDLLRYAEHIARAVPHNVKSEYDPLSDDD